MEIVTVRVGDLQWQLKILTNERLSTWNTESRLITPLNPGKLHAAQDGDDDVDGIIVVDIIITKLLIHNSAKSPLSHSMCQENLWLFIIGKYERRRNAIKWVTWTAEEKCTWKCKLRDCWEYSKIIRTSKCTISRLYIFNWVWFWVAI